MFLFERLFGVFTYIVLLVAMYLLIPKIKQSQLKYVLVLYIFILCIMSYNYAPYITSDLYRIDIYAKNYSQYTLKGLFQLCIENETPLASTPAAVFYYGILGNGARIAAISCAVMFSMFFSVIYDMRSRVELSQNSLALVIMGFMCLDVFMPMIATIRSYLSCTLVAFCIYREMTRKKLYLIHIFLYVIAALMHSIGILLVLLRIAFYVYYEQDTLAWKLVMAGLVVIAAGVLSPFYIRFLNSSLSSLRGYIYNHEAYSYFWEQLICGIHFCVYWRIYVWFKKWIKAGTSVQHVWVKYQKLLKICLLIYAFSFIQFAMMQRFGFFFALIGIPAVAVFLENNKRKVNNYFCVSLMLLALTCSRGYLCSLKFW